MNRLKVKWGRLCLAVSVTLLASSFFPFFPEDKPVQGCVPGSTFRGYSLLQPNIINPDAAYAPFFVHWDEYYQEFYFKYDIQRKDNVLEWIDRFCGQPFPKDVDDVVYKATITDLIDIGAVADDKTGKRLLPFGFENNTFAISLSFNKCHDVLDYLVFAKKCEPLVTHTSDAWSTAARDTVATGQLIREGLGRFDQTKSHFLKMRYAYQLVRLAHYSRQYERTIELFNGLMPKIDKKKPSILFYWLLGHVAGALQKLGRVPEAAYRYAIIFRNCPSKRTQAFRSFFIRNDQDWETALRLCQNDAEKATLFLLRAGGARTHVIDEMQQIYALEPANPQLELLLVSMVQQLERVFLRTDVTEKKRGADPSIVPRETAAKELLDLQSFVRLVVREKQSANPALWRTMGAYLEALAGDTYAARQSIRRARNMLNGGKDYDDHLLQQLGILEVLCDILDFDAKDPYIDDKVMQARSYAAFKDDPDLDLFMQDLLSTRYAAAGFPGKAILVAWPASAISYNLQPEVLDDLLREAEKDNPVFLERYMLMDTSPDQTKARLLEMKGTYYLARGETEAALAAYRAIPPSQYAGLELFQPFKEVYHEKIRRFESDTVSLTRPQIAEKLLQYSFSAKAAEAVGSPDAARYYFLLGLGWYNMSYFGYSWEALDYLRSGRNWTRLSRGPVFPLAGSPAGNRENLDVQRALEHFVKAIALTDDPELAAKATFLAARCQQKQWLGLPDTAYRPGNRTIPLPSREAMYFYDLLMSRYSQTAFYEKIIRECKWFAAYARR